jgi:hypothetical protein
MTAVTAAHPPPPSPPPRDCSGSCTSSRCRYGCTGSLLSSASWLLLHSQPSAMVVVAAAFVAVHHGRGHCCESIRCCNHSHPSPFLCHSFCSCLLPPLLLSWSWSLLQSQLFITIMVVMVAAARPNGTVAIEKGESVHLMPPLRLHRRVAAVAAGQCCCRWLWSSVLSALFPLRSIKCCCCCCSCTMVK